MLLGLIALQFSVYHRFHSSSGRFQTGYVKGGEFKLPKEIAYSGNVDGTIFYTLRLVVDNSSSKSTKVFLDGIKMGDFQEHFPSKMKGGVFTYQGYGNVGLFKNFEMR